MIEAKKILLFTALCLIAATACAVMMFAAPAFAAGDRVAGDFMIVFKPNDMMLAFGKDVPDSVLSAALEFQGEYLKHRYSVEVLGTYPEITRGNGMGMFHIHSKKAAMSNVLFDDVMKKLKGDPNIESVSENRISRITRL